MPYKFLQHFCITDIDGLVVCTKDWQSLEIWFPRPSGGLRQRPSHRPLQHPAAPSVPPVDGWCVSSSNFTFTYVALQKTKLRSTSTPVAMRPATGTADQRGAYLLLILLLLRGLKWASALILLLPYHEHSADFQMELLFGLSVVPICGLFSVSCVR